MNLLFALLFPSHISILVLYEKWHTILYLKVLHFPYIIVRDFSYSKFPRKNFSVSYTFILLLNDTNFYYKNQRRQFSNGYLARFSTITCCTLSIYTFSYRAPYGMKAMGALANAAIASFLIEAFHRYIGGEMFHNDFYNQ